MKTDLTFQVSPQVDGEDLVVPLPPELVEALNIHEGQRVELTIEGDAFRLTPKISHDSTASA